MEKEFVPYDESLALKELGFNEKCLAGFYTYVDENLILDKYDYRGKFNINYSDKDDYIINTDKTYYISAPLYQQAFKWFRDKYGIDSYVEKMIGGGSGISEVYIGVIQKLSLNTDDFSWETPSVYDTYEEAELECLKKLIEIVKNK